MFGTIRKHQTWLWMVIITLTIISFVIFFSPYSKMNSGRRTGSFGSINGERVTEQGFINARREVEMHYFFNNHRWPEEERQKSKYDPERETYQWLLLIQKEEQLGIHVGDDVAERAAREMITPFERNERLRLASPAEFVTKVLGQKGITIEDFERYVRHYVGIQELISTVGLSGVLVTPQDARAMYEREHQEIAADAVFFSASNYLAGITVNPDTLSQFYSNRIATYAIPDRVQVSYVRFNVTNYLAQAETQVTNMTEVIDNNLQRLGTNLATLFPDAKTDEEKKAKIREQVLRSRAMEDAKRASLEFANVLFDRKTATTNTLAELAQSNQLAVAVSAPFDREEGPKDIEGGPDLIKIAFALTPDEPFGGPIQGQDGFYVLAFNKTLPRELPPLDQIRDKVTADYKHAQAVVLAQQAGMSFYQAATNGLAQGKGFTNVCAEAKATAVQLPPFSLSTRSLPGFEEMVPLNTLQQAAFTTMPGKISNLQPTSEGAMLLYVKAKLPVDQAKLQADLPGFMSSLRRTREYEAFNIWLNRECQRGLHDTPVGRPQPPPSMSSSGAKT